MNRSQINHHQGNELAVTWNPAHQEINNPCCPPEPHCWEPAVHQITIRKRDFEKIFELFYCSLLKVKGAVRIRYTMGRSTFYSQKMVKLKDFLKNCNIGNRKNQTVPTSASVLLASEMASEETQRTAGQRARVSGSGAGCGSATGAKWRRLSRHEAWQFGT